LAYFPGWTGGTSMTTYEKVILKPSASLYIRETLAAGNALARTFLDIRGLNDGVISAYLPKEMKGTAIVDYSYANAAKRADSMACLVDFIADFVSEHECGICVLENQYAKRGEPATLKYRSKIVNFNDEVYHLIDGNEFFKRQLGQQLLRLTRL
jgi:hypothetical protein